MKKQNCLYLRNISEQISIRKMNKQNKTWLNIRYDLANAILLMKIDLSCQTWRIREVYDKMTCINRGLNESIRTVAR